MKNLNLPRFVVAIVLIYFAMWGLAVVLHHWIFPGIGKELEGMMREGFAGSSFFYWQLVGYLVLVVFFALIFTYGYEGRGVGEGVRYGVLMGVLLGAADFAWMIGFPVSLADALLLFLTDVIMWAVAGAILAVVYRPGSDAQEDAA